LPLSAAHCPRSNGNLFDAVIEDCECELAATREAMVQMVAEMKKKK
jgi:hypothetical protein